LCRHSSKQPLVCFSSKFNRLKKLTMLENGDVFAFTALFTGILKLPSYTMCDVHFGLQIWWQMLFMSRNKAEKSWRKSLSSFSRYWNLNCSCANSDFAHFTAHHVILNVEPTDFQSVGRCEHFFGYINC
jgi:hypothetical protein